MTSNVQNLYDEVSQRYDEVVEATDYFGPRWLARELNESIQPESVLDLGCATGTLGIVLRSAYPDATITGVDISPRMIELADERGCYDRTIVHDLNSELEFDDESFDVVTALGFMEFLAEPTRTLRDISRLLKPGAFAYISFQEHWPENPEKAPRSTRSEDVIHHAYTLEEAVNMISAAGMEVISSSSEIGYTSRAGFSCPYVFCKGRAI